jgi:UDP-glucuronate 4-epimerase
MHALVTGGAGFVGSHLVDSLLLDGHSVTVLDNFDPFYARTLKEENIAVHRTHPAWRLVEADLRDPPRLVGALRGGGYDVIVHLAAKAGIRPSIEDPLLYQDVNVTGTQHLLELARTEGIPRFVFASSSSVYGVNPRVPWSETDRVLLPISPYASTKVSGELLGHVYSHLYGIRFTAVRIFTVYGPRQRPDLAIHKFASLMLKGKPIPMFGMGDTRRDYTYVDDAVAGIRAAIAYDRSPYEIINLGNERTITLRTMVEGLEHALGVRATVEHLPEQPGDVPQTWANISKARALLGYEPRVGYREGVGRFVDWITRTPAPQGRGVIDRHASETAGR